MLLFVWLAAWEMDCCQPELTVGDEWGGSLYLGPAEPWWSRYANSPLDANARDLGVTEFDGDVVQAARSETEVALVLLGDARLGVIGAISAGRHRFRGRLDFEAHGGGDPGTQREDLECRGTVRRIRGVSYISGANELEPEDEEMSRVPVALGEVRDLHTTFDRAFTGGHEFQTYLIDLEVS